MPRKIGTVLHFSAQGNIIARVEHAIRLGTLLFTSDAKPVGRVIDIFGPASKPFASLKPESNITPAVLPPGSALLQAKVRKGGGGKRRRKT